MNNRRTGILRFQKACPCENREQARLSIIYIICIQSLKPAIMWGTMHRAQGKLCLVDTHLAGYTKYNKTGRAQFIVPLQNHKNS